MIQWAFSANFIHSQLMFDHYHLVRRKKDREKQCVHYRHNIVFVIIHFQKRETRITPN